MDYCTRDTMSYPGPGQCCLRCGKSGTLLKPAAETHSVQLRAKVSIVLIGVVGGCQKLTMQSGIDGTEMHRLQVIQVGQASKYECSTGQQ